VPASFIGQWGPITADTSILTERMSREAIIDIREFDRLHSTVLTYRRANKNVLFGKMINFNTEYANSQNG